MVAQLSKYTKVYCTLKNVDETLWYIDYISSLYI